MKTLPVLACLALAACTKEPAKSAPAEAANNYTVNIAAHAPYAAGQEASALITVTAAPGLHVNPEYPVAFKPEGSEAVKFGDERVRLTAGTKTPCADKAEDACRVEFPLPLTPEKAGAAKVAGVLAFSVCSPEKCLIEKVPLTLAIAVE